MELTTMQGAVKVKWYYIPVKQRRISTRCILTLTDGVTEQIGVTLCSKKDNFCRETGRKISLARAVDNLDRDFRKEIWGAYFNRSKKTNG